MPGPTWSKSLPIARWPARDREAWYAAMRPGDPFEPGGVASRWSAATRRKTALGYGRFLLWLEARGELHDEEPADRVTRDRVKPYLDELKQTNRGHTIQSRIQELGNAMRAIAPHRDWRWLSRAAGRLRANTVPARDKRARLRPVEELDMLGFRLMTQAGEDGCLSELGRAALHRDGLVIAFLVAHPLRPRNLASLRLGHHLMERGDVFVLKLSAAETKARIPYEAVIAPRLAAAFSRYIHHYRPVLLRAKGRWRREAGDALWISRDGSPCTQQTFTNIIRKRTREAGRPTLSPHLFRSCAASSIAVDAPDDVDIIPAVLGHGSPKTAERHYNLAGSLEASRAHGRLIEALCDELVHRPRRRRP